MPETFAAMPPGREQCRLWTARIAFDCSSTVSAGLIPTRIRPANALPKRRVVQALHLMNAKNLHQEDQFRRWPGNWLSKSKKTPNEIIDELYLLVYSRLPDDRSVRSPWSGS